jgi:phosphonate transport system substrate-binding protein
MCPVQVSRCCFPEGRRIAMKRTRALFVAISPFLVTGMILTTGRPATAGSPAGTQPGTSLEQGILSVGSISRKPRQETAKFQPFVDYLARGLAAAGITQGRVVVAGSMAEMADLMKGRQVDLYIDSPFPMALVSMRSGAQPFLRRWKGGKGDYHSAIFARQDSGIETPRDLLGKMVAFEKPDSTSGHLLAKTALMQAGMRLTQYTDPWAEVPPNRIGYVFADTEKKVMTWVLQDRVAAGALSEDEVDELGGDRRGELKIVHRTVDVPRQAVAHRADLPPVLVAKIEEVLLGMDSNDEGRRVLQGFEKTAKFDRFPQGGAQTFDPIKALARMVEGEVGQ